MPTQSAPGARAIRQGLLVLGNQLFDPRHLQGHAIASVFMREDVELCSYYKFHSQKIVFFLAAMRSYAQELRQAGYDVTYQGLARGGPSYEDALVAWARAHKFAQLSCFEIEDKFFEARIATRLAAEGIALEVLRSPMFLTSREDFAGYLEQQKRPFMKTFYQLQRKSLGVLIEGRGEPVGGKWSFDELNRQPLPREVEVPRLPQVPMTQAVREAAALCREHFADHPGSADGHWLPVERAGAKAWLNTFFAERLKNFGPYEDALTERSDTVFHGVLSPLLNVGLLTPDDVLQLALHHARAAKTPLASLEGFVRQLIGWREFIRGIYRNYSERQESQNHWNHQRKLSSAWYGAQTGVPPLDAVLAKVMRLGYAHHIERLMVVGSLMLLLEVHPHEAHRWFMEMFVDSSDWVMGPNVYGMAIHSDGGIFATKPYMCGSNYYRKMGGYKKGPWCDGVDGLYWRFIDKHRDFFLHNPRLSTVARGVDRIDPERRGRIFAAADVLQQKLTVAP